MPISTDQLDIAREAWRRYGKGNHPAIASTENEPLLFKGGDFAQTDIPAA